MHAVTVVLSRLKSDCVDPGKDTDLGRLGWIWRGSMMSVRRDSAKVSKTSLSGFSAV
jgi:hypothetical protein